MRFLKKSFWLVVLFIFLPLGALADDFWEEDVPVNGNYAQMKGHFTAVGFRVPAGSQFSYFDGQKWQAVEMDDYGDDAIINFSELIFWGKSEDFYLRLDSGEADYVQAYFSRIDKKVAVGASASTSKTATINIISRQEWGASESLRYSSDKVVADTEQKSDNGESLSASEQKCVNAQKSFPDEFEINKVVGYENNKKLTWPLQYSKTVRKVVVHHTGTDSGENLDSTDKVKAIYQYHTVTRGWGDIGYHYLIGRDGKIYEGRAGGDYVVGGHVYCNNIGTVGIALIGNFQEQEPSLEQLKSLSKLSLYLAQKYKLDLTAKEWFHGSETYNLIGYKDIGATACPGLNLYAYLPKLREIISNSDEIKFARQFFIDGKLVGKLSVLNMKAGQEKKVTVTFKNTGMTTWGSSTWLFADTGQGSRVMPIVADKDYVVARMRELEVKPGGEAHFDITIKADYDGDFSTILLVPVVDGRRVKNAEAIQVIEVERPKWAAEIHSISTNPAAILKDQAFTINVSISNKGNFTWPKEDLYIEAKSLSTRQSKKLLMTKDTGADEIATFSASFDPINREGDQVFYFQLFADGQRKDITFVEKISIEKASKKASIENFNIKTIIAQTGTILSKEIMIKNTGSLTLENPSIIVNGQENSLNQSLTPGNSANITINISITDGKKMQNLIVKDKGEELYKKSFLLVGSQQLNKTIEIQDKKVGGLSVSVPYKDVYVSPTALAPSTILTSPSDNLTEEAIRIRLSFSKIEAIIKSKQTFNIYDENNNLIQIISVDSDITEIIKAEHEIINQKNILEEKNAEINRYNENLNSSIRYALTIQESILPFKKQYDEFADNFIIYIPKDIVSGDFYWYAETDEYHFSAVVDCTGHGVPGAFMSLIASRLLNKIVKDNNVTNPSEILEFLDAFVISTLKQHETGNRDGMDVGICRVSKNKFEGKTEILFAGAKQDLLLYQKSENSISRIRGTRKAIGGTGSKRNTEQFFNFEYLAEKGDTLYLMTDGYKDQNNKKRDRFGTSRLIVLLEQTMHLSMENQKEIITDILEKFKEGEKNRDDITILSLRFR